MHDRQATEFTSVRFGFTFAPAFLADLNLLVGDTLVSQKLNNWVGTAICTWEILNLDDLAGGFLKTANGSGGRSEIGS